jgi:hypothetical protein
MLLHCDTVVVYAAEPLRHHHASPLWWWGEEGWRPRVRGVEAICRQRSEREREG